VDDELITRTPNLESFGDSAANGKFTSSGAVFTLSGSEKSANRAASQFTEKSSAATNSSMKWNSQSSVSTTRSALLNAEMNQPLTDDMSAKNMPSASSSGPVVAKKSMPPDATSGPAVSRKSMPHDATSGPAVAKKSNPNVVMSGPAVAKKSMPNDAGERSVPKGTVPLLNLFCAVSKNLYVCVVSLIWI
jgi:hypothetical protein